MASNKYEIIILFDGFSKQNEQGLRANCTCTLLKSPRFNIIIDTRTSWDGNAIINALRAHNLKPIDITHCICTHGHSDHIGCNYLFTEALQIVGKNCISRKDQYYVHDFQKPYTIDEQVKVIETAGHSGEDISILVESRNEKTRGIVAIVGDLFEKQEDMVDDAIWRECSEFPEMQERSRQRILKMADYIVPGHGPMFKNKQRN